MRHAHSGKPPTKSVESTGQHQARKVLHTGSYAHKHYRGDSLEESAASIHETDNRHLFVAEPRDSKMISRK